MAEDWTAVAADVVAAIADVGFDVAIVRRTAGPETPHDATAVVTTSTAVKAIDAKPRWFRADGLGEFIHRRGLLVGVGATVPLVGDQITVRARSHTIVNVRTVAPGGQDLLHIVELSE